MTIRSLPLAVAVALVASLVIASTALARTDAPPRKPCLKTTPHACKKPAAKPTKQPSKPVKEPGNGTAKSPVAKHVNCLTMAPIAWMNQITGLGLTSVDVHDPSRTRAETLVSSCSYKNARYHGEASAINFGFYDKKSVNPTAASVWKMISTGWQRTSDEKAKNPDLAMCGPSPTSPPSHPAFCTAQHPFGPDSIELGPQIMAFKDGNVFSVTGAGSAYGADAVPVPVLEAAMRALLARY